REGHVHPRLPDLLRHEDAEPLGIVGPRDRGVALPKYAVAHLLEVAGGPALGVRDDHRLVDEDRHAEGMEVPRAAVQVAVGIAATSQAPKDGSAETRQVTPVLDSISWASATAFVRRPTGNWSPTVFALRPQITSSSRSVSPMDSKTPRGSGKRCPFRPSVSSRVRSRSAKASGAS